MMRRFCPALFLALPLAAAEPMPPAEILQQLRAFATTGTVLHVGAHPDDENTELITYFSRGRGYRTAYLSLTRGDGGQNELGPDFDEKLGVLRTQELIAARKIDGGRQFFTRAIDFGYSKTPEETLRFWDRKQVLGDVVRIYRQFRPDVVITRFPIPPGSGGHGHHTASAILAVEAFKLAGDPNAYPEQIAEGLAPWQPRRIFWNTFRFGSNTGPLPLDGPVTKLDISGIDAATGEEFGQIAARSRAMHATQGLAGFINRARTGPNEQNFLLLGGDPVTTDLFDGIDTTWARLAGGEEIPKLIEAVIAAFEPENPASIVPALIEIRNHINGLGISMIDERLESLDRIIFSAAGLSFSTTVDRPDVIPKEEAELTFSAIVSSRVPVSLTQTQISGAGPFTVLRVKKNLSPGVPFNAAFRLPLDFDTPTQPYWLRKDYAAGIHNIDDSDLIGLPETPPDIEATYYFQIYGHPFTARDECSYLTPDVTAKMQRRRLTVVPPISLRLKNDVMLIAPGSTNSAVIQAKVARSNMSGVLTIEVPEGWKVSPAQQDFNLASAGDNAAFTFTVTAPSTGGTGWLNAFAEVDGRRYSHQRIELRYDHLPAQLLQPPARARLLSADVAIKGKTIGYLPGAGDSTAETLTQMGYTVRSLTGADLTPEKLAGFDAVVIGVRAFNERADLKDNLPGLFAWVEQGGTVVAQYNRPNGLLADQLGPYALSLAGPAPQQRITDETAPFTFLAPDHPVLNLPNKITPADFDGWVQERGAYFPSKWDPAYTPILAGSDPGETPLHGALLVAKHGRGHYIYTSLAFFRQLPAGVPGAWRLFANLVSLGK